MGDLGSIPGLGSPPGEGNGNPLQCSCLENPTDRGAWQATVHGVARVGYDLGLSFFLSSPTPITLAWGFSMLLQEWQSYWSNSSTHYHNSKGQGTLGTVTSISISLAFCVCASTRLSLLLSSACSCLSVFLAWMGSLSIEDRVRPNLTIPWSWKGNQHSRRRKTDARLFSCWASGQPTPQILKQSLVGTASPNSEARLPGSNPGSTTDWLCFGQWLRLSVTQFPHLVNRNNIVNSHNYLQQMLTYKY